MKDASISYSSVSSQTGNDSSSITVDRISSETQIQVNYRYPYFINFRIFVYSTSDKQSSHIFLRICRNLVGFVEKLAI